MNKNFINKLLTIAILSICNNYINASDNSVPVVQLRENFVIDKVSDFKIIDSDSETNAESDKNSNKSSSSHKSTKQNKPSINNIINGDDLKNNSKTNSKNAINENKEVKYDPDKMWFDYQALFDNTKNTMLEKSGTKTN